MTLYQGALGNCLVFPDALVDKPGKEFYRICPFVLLYENLEI
jgi:hypothetical protein